MLLPMGDDKITIRLARKGDLASIREIEAAAGRLFLKTDFPSIAEDEPMSLATLSRYQGNDQIRVAVNREDFPIGFAVTGMVDGLVHLQELSIHPDYARRGIGRDLILAVCSLAEELGKPGVTLSTFREIPWNAPYYERLGFRILSDAELTDGLRQLRAAESRLGLPVDHRVFMRKEL
jgi:ribosomal protein S18 acetylase RimI-like enzyme